MKRVCGSALCFALGPGCNASVRGLVVSHQLVCNTVPSPRQCWELWVARLLLQPLRTWHRLCGHLQKWADEVPLSCDNMSTCPNVVASHLHCHHSNHVCCVTCSPCILFLSPALETCLCAVPLPWARSFHCSCAPSADGAVLSQLSKALPGKAAPSDAPQDLLATDTTP